MTRGRRAAAGVLLSVVLIGGCGNVGAAPRTLYDRTVDYFDRWAEQREEQPVEIADGMRSFAPSRSATSVARPVRISLPSVGISSRLERLGVAEDGSIETPDDWQRAGWYRGGPRPGEHGAAVILGHVDSTTGPAVFYRLRRLKPGEEIRVTRGDGSVAVFEVDRVEQHRKTRFPTDRVYFPTPTPTLRLVTCGGDFDSAAGSYRDNLVVFATLKSVGA